MQLPSLPGAAAHQQALGILAQREVGNAVPRPQGLEQRGIGACTPGMAGWAGGRWQGDAGAAQAPPPFPHVATAWRRKAQGSARHRASRAARERQQPHQQPPTQPGCSGRLQSCGKRRCSALQVGGRADQVGRLACFRRCCAEARWPCRWRAGARAAAAYPIPSAPWPLRQRGSVASRSATCCGGCLGDVAILKVLQGLAAAGGAQQAQVGLRGRGPGDMQWRRRTASVGGRLAMTRAGSRSARGAHLAGGAMATRPQLGHGRGIRAHAAGQRSASKRGLCGEPSHLVLA